MHEPTEEEADQLLTVRTLLEAEAARLAAANAGTAGITALEELCAEGERAVADDDVDGAVAMNARFHAKVMELAGNAVLAELAAQVDRRVRCTTPRSPGSAATSPGSSTATSSRPSQP